MAEHGSVNSPVERGEGFVFTRKPLSGHVCVSEREAEWAPSQPGLPSQGSGSWLSQATLTPWSLGQDTAALPRCALPHLRCVSRRLGDSVQRGGGVWPALALHRGLVAAAPERVLCSLRWPSAGRRVLGRSPASALPTARPPAASGASPAPVNTSSWSFQSSLSPSPAGWLWAACEALRAPVSASGRWRWHPPQSVLRNKRLAGHALRTHTGLAPDQPGCSRCRGPGAGSPRL